MLEEGIQDTANCKLANWELPEEFDESTLATVKIQGQDFDVDVQLRYTGDVSSLSYEGGDIPDDFGGSLILIQDTPDELYYNVSSSVTQNWNLTLLSFEHNGKLLYPAE